MKASSSSSSPFSCNGHETLPFSINRKTTGWCITRILRRILCFSSVSSSSCPFDYVNEDEIRNSSMVSGTPGIVARLMGLDSIPIKKSGSPRRLIIPMAYQELEDDNFFILSFESHVQRRKSVKNCEKLLNKKKKSMRRIEKLQEMDNKENMVSSKGYLLEKNSNISGIISNNVQVENCSNVLRPLKNSCESIRKKQAKGDRLAKIHFETEIDSENSSPNSVLEFFEFPADQEASSSSSGNVSRLANSRMRRTLSEDLENCEKSKEKRALLINNNGFGKKEKLSRLRRSLKQNVYHEIGELATMEVMNLSWLDDEISRNKLHLNEIGTDLASKILHQLLDELLINLEFF